MQCDSIVWNYVFKALNEKYWDECLTWVPTFYCDLSENPDLLANFEFTPEGFNSIKLSKNQNLTTQELIGVLLHEMCHQFVFQNYGFEVAPHGKEWQAAMRNVGFVGKINEETSGLEFCDENLCAEVIARHNELINEFGINS